MEARAVRGRGRVVELEAVWLTQEDQHWEVVVRLRGGDKVRFRCASRAEARSCAAALVFRARELSQGLQGWTAQAFAQLGAGLTTIN
jgi:hypothetical protein